MSKFLQYIPSVEDALALEAEELAGYLLAFLNSEDFREERQGGAERIVQESFLYRLQEYLIRKASEHADAAHARSRPTEAEEKVREQAGKLAEAVLEAWAWLERECLLIRMPDGSFFVARRGTGVKEYADLAAMRKADLLPRRLLHAAIASKVWSPFLRGDYDTAIFSAFKEVEIAVRGAGNYQPNEIGVPLMRKAFHLDTGNLTDKSLPKGEQQGMTDLFAGAIGCCRNPSGHRHLAVDASEAVEMIMLASHLLRVVDRAIRRQA